MKSTFHHRLVNSHFEDPCLYVRLLRESRALLFDAGNISRLSPGEMLKVSDLFITHTHIDHFIGFDTLLRTLLRREQPLRVFGPAGITACIEGKLHGYTWNLIEDYPLKIEVFAISGDTMQQTSFHSSERFRKISQKPTAFDGTVLKEPTFTVSAVSLTHDIQCLGYALEEDFHINIDKAALLAMGLPVGPWINDLKQALRGPDPNSNSNSNLAPNPDPDMQFTIGQNSYTLSELRHIAIITKGQKLAFVLDTAPEEENLRRIKQLAKDADTLYLEAYFMDKDHERAMQRHHLTGRLAGQVAREAGASNLVVTHFSPKYKQTGETPEREAMEEFKKD